MCLAHKQFAASKSECFMAARPLAELAHAAIRAGMPEGEECVLGRVLGRVIEDSWTA
jgi:hypothetical protein